MAQGYHPLSPGLRLQESGVSQLASCRLTSSWSGRILLVGMPDPLDASLWQRLKTSKAMHV